MAVKVPRLFDPSLYLVEPESLIYFFLGVILAFPASSWTFLILKHKKLQLSGIISFVSNHLGGLLLAIFFFFLYLLIGSIFNQPIFNYIDTFFDTDVYLWRLRFATEHYQDMSHRPVHPYINIIIRPLVALISLFLKGDTLYATFVLVALTGAFCVFLVWYFIKQFVDGPLYATLVAAIFGSSTSQLIMGSFIETYIFLAAASLIFLILLLKDKPQYTLVITGLTTFGITFLNFAQIAMTHLLIKRDIKQWIKYGLIVAVLVVPINLLNNYIYPDDHPYLWNPSSYGREEKHSFDPTLQRAHYLGRVMFLHSTVAPEPVFFKEGGPFVKMWFFRAAIRKAPMLIAQYDGWFASTVAYLWFAFMLLGGVLFLKNLLRQDNRYSFNFILTIIFFFVLHMFYGRDVFLYAPNWMYAIFLFLALAWRELANKRWFQIALLGFLPLLLINNLSLFFLMLAASSAHK
ncbi:MAG: hypothetical protein H7Y59_01310 [Anaerolineales bacterium]|nr:hypothetical protein [Anaerolineales bacterium]